MRYELIEPDDQDAYDPTPFLSYARRRSEAKGEQVPVVGDVVHFWDDDAVKCRPATVADIIFERDGQTSECLAVLDSDAEEVRWLPGIPHKEQKKRLSWHWPEST